MATVEQISEMPVADAKPLIAKLSADDARKLSELETAKGEDKQRKGVLDAITARLADLDGEAGDAEQDAPAELTVEQRLDRIEHALASGDPTAIALTFGR